MDGSRGDRSFDAYLEEIQRFPLLTAAEETALARRVQAQDRDHIDAMIAKDEMIKRNLRLVVSVAKRFRGRGLNLPDLVEEGNLGLVHAVEKFDPEMGTRFSTYAIWWIRQAIRRSLMNTVKTVRTPTYLAEELGRWRRFAARFEQERGREPTEEEIVAAMRPPAGRRRFLFRLFRNATPGVGTLSLDLLFESAETVVDPRSERPDAIDFSGWEKEQVVRALDGLPQREARILAMRYGLGEHDGEMSLRQIGDALGLSRERVRQLEHIALGRLRRAIEGRRLSGRRRS
jgi:RNA polymerase primary sigma factor